MITEIEFIGNCEHFGVEDISSHRCRKRYYNVMSIKTGRNLKLGICNEKIKMLFHDHYSKQYYDPYFVVSYDLYIKGIVSKIIRNYIENEFNIYTNCYGDNSGRIRDLTKIKFPIVLCKNPYIFTYINIIDAIKLYIDGNREILSDIRICLFRWIDNNIHFKDYKSKYKDVIRSIKHLDNYWNEEEKIIGINNILINILELKTKTK